MKNYAILKESDIKYSYFIIFLDESNFTYKKAQKEIDEIYEEIGFTCIEFTSHNDEMLIVKSCLNISEISSKIKKHKVQYVGRKTGLGIDIPVLN